MSPEVKQLLGDVMRGVIRQWGNPELIINGGAKLVQDQATGQIALIYPPDGEEEQDPCPCDFNMAQLVLTEDMAGWSQSRGIQFPLRIFWAINPEDGDNVTMRDLVHILLGLARRLNAVGEGIVVPGTIAEPEQSHAFYPPEGGGHPWIEIAR
jgi:hypothetical protein